jgi:predicted enzyme related to lactoylglutathione lyase
MAVRSIAFTWYSAENVAKLLAFYRDVLGLRVDRAHPNEEEATFVEFDIGNDHWFSLLPVSFVDQAAGTNHGVVFEVDDIDAVLENVRKHAKTADEKAADFPNCRMASFTDPEGNKVGLHQMKAG